MKNFIHKLLSDKGEVSSKRFIAILGAVVLFAVVAYAVATGKPVDHHIYDGLIVVVLGAAGITAVEKIKGLASMPEIPLNQEMNQTQTP